MPPRRLFDESVMNRLEIHQQIVGVLVAFGGVFGEGFVDEDYERQVREIAESIERLELIDYPDPVQENLSDEEFLAHIEAGIAQAMEALEDDLAARREEERRLEDAAREN